jgi:hypothetical protein
LKKLKFIEIKANIFEHFLIFKTIFSSHAASLLSKPVLRDQLRDFPGMYTAAAGRPSRPADFYFWFHAGA